MARMAPSSAYLFRLGRADREEEQHTGLEVHGHHVPAHGQYSKRKQHGQQQCDRREKMYNLVRSTRYQVFLGQCLDPVRGRLQQTERPDAIWSVAILNAPQPLAFEPGGDCKQGGEHDDDRRD
jgi:hypothetical protein